jgi:hypothetical protein
MRCVTEMLDDEYAVYFGCRPEDLRAEGVTVLTSGRHPPDPRRHVDRGPGQFGPRGPGAADGRPRELLPKRRSGATDAPAPRLCLNNPCNAPFAFGMRAREVPSPLSEEGACEGTS